MRGQAGFFYVDERLKRLTDLAPGAIKIANDPKPRPIPSCPRET
jgi:hypothetical protein